MKYIDADKMIRDTEAMKVVAEGITIDGIVKYIKDNAINISTHTFVRRLCYGLYRLDWCYINNVSFQTIKTILTDYYEDILTGNIDTEISLSDYVFEHGINGSIYACFNEFLDNEYLDSEYIQNLLRNEREDFLILYKKDRKELLDGTDNSLQENE